MNIEDLKKRKELLETNLRGLRDKVAQDSQNLLRIESALIDTNELIAEEEKLLKEEKEKDKVEKKGNK